MMSRNARLVLYAAVFLLLIVLVAVAWQSTMEQQRLLQRERLGSGPQLQYCARMETSAAQAAMDALAMALARPGTLYQQDYRVQRMQLRANWLGMERLAGQDALRQGQLMEVRASVADLQLALDQMATATAPPSPNDQARCMAALQRAERALSNYAGGLGQAVHTGPARSVSAWRASVGVGLTMLLLVCGALMVALEWSLRRNEAHRTAADGKQE